MSATQTQRRQRTADEAQFLAPGTPRHAEGGKKTATSKADKQKAKGFAPETFEPGDLVLIPLSLLVASPFNARRSGGDDVTELAELIAAQGLLQNLVVHEDHDKRGKPTGNFGVNAGGRRRRALVQLAKDGRVSKDMEVLCRFVSRAEALASSMAENSGREPMSAADTIAAFADMASAGASVEELAVCFGVTALTVRRRLKLANVAPELFEVFRGGQMSLEQLMALAVTEDHEAQRRVWESTSPHDRSERNLRRLLLGRATDAQTDPVARYVGLKAYEAAGGAVVRDLFGEDGNGFIQDVELLERLAQERLQVKAAKVRAEGWSWVEVRTQFGYSDQQAFGTARTGRREPSAAQAASLASLKEEHDKADAELEALYDDDDGEFDQAKASKLESTIEKARTETEKIERSLAMWPSEVLAVAGAVVTIDRAGAAVVHRGLVKPEDRKAAQKAAQQAVGAAQGHAEAAGEGGAPDGKGGLSESLVRKLTAHKTCALQLALAGNGRVALAALAHVMVHQLVSSPMGYTPSALSVRAHGCLATMSGAADDIEGAKAWVALNARLGAWRERLPAEEDALLPWLLEQPTDVVLELLALCAALTVNGVVGREGDHASDDLAKAVGLDMAEWWKPTAESYLAQVPKARIVEAVADAVSAEKAAPLAKMKKPDAVAAAQALLANTRWLPSPLRARGSAAGEAQ